MVKLSTVDLKKSLSLVFRTSVTTKEKEIISQVEQSIRKLKDLDW